MENMFFLKIYCFFFFCSGKASGKKSRLAKQARPKKKQIWVGGAVVEDRPDLFYFQVLKFPEEAYDNKPRGKQELLECFQGMDLRKGDVLVTDGWKGTMAAVDALSKGSPFESALFFPCVFTECCVGG